MSKKPPQKNAKKNPKENLQRNQKQKAKDNSTDWTAIRQQAAESGQKVAHKAGHHAGEITARAEALFQADADIPLSKHLLLVFILLFFVLFFLWANLAPLDEVTRGDGKVIPSSEVQALQSLDAGIVEEFLVREGDSVEKGQVLIRLSDIEASSDLGANRARYLGLLASITRLQAEAEGKSTVTFPDEVMKGAPESVTEELNAFRANRQALQGQVNILEQQRMQRQQEIRELETRVSDIRGVIRLQREEMQMVEPLVASGAAPRMELLQLERAIKEKTAELNTALQSLPRARSAADEVEARIQDIENSSRSQAQTELAAKLVEMSEIKERLSALTERKTRTELKAPVAGIIQEITVNTVGGVVRPGEDIIKIVPDDDQLIVEAKIRPSDRAFIYPGQKAVIKITAYDFSIYGGLDGEVLDISADTIEDEQGNSFFRVRLRTSESELKRKGEILPIIPGMVASVDILTGEKTVMQYLLKPFVKTLDSAMNER